MFWTNLNVWANVVGGIAVLLSYAFVLPKLSANEWWANMSTPLQTAFKVSIMFAVISYVIAFVYGLGTPFPWEYYLALTMFFVGASLWAPMVWIRQPILVGLALWLTSIGALGMSIFSGDWIVCLFMLVVFLHCLIMDNAVWYFFYLDSVLPSIPDR